jgi:acyl transferase domain-containing protein
MEWKRGEAPRRAGVSAMGIGGTNAHVVLEEAPIAESSSASRTSQLLLLSAKTPSALRAMSVRLAEHLEKHPEESLADVAYTLQRGRQRFRHRQIVSANSTGEAIERLRAAEHENKFTGESPAQDPSVVFLFPGQGSQYVNMGRELYQSESLFHDAVDRCAECLEDHLGFDIRSVLYPHEAHRSEAEQQIHETRVTQPAIFTLEYALATLWQSWGIKPSLLIGHSVGEYVAAVLAGVFALEDALAILAGRAKMMQDLPGGSMLAVRKGHQEIEKLLPEGVALAAINSPFLTTLSGPTETLKELQKSFDASGIFCRILPTSHAFHSSMMDPIVKPFEELAGSVRAEKPRLPWISTLTGEYMDPQSAPDGPYWASQLRHTVRFGQAVETAIKSGATVFLEVGPGQALTQLTLQQPSKPAGFVAVTSLGAYDAKAIETEAMLSSLGRLWISGIEADWKKFYAHEKRNRLSLPTYPFERKSYWIAPPPQIQASAQINLTGASERKVNGNGKLVESTPSPVAAPEITTSPQRGVAAETQLTACRLIEQQVQLMTQQLEMLRKRAVAGKSNHVTQ